MSRAFRPEVAKNFILQGVVSFERIQNHALNSKAQISIQRGEEQIHQFPSGWCQESWHLQKR